MQASVQKWGNSHGIRIPKHIMTSLSIVENEILDIKTEDEKIIITKAISAKRKNIDELFADFNEEYQLEDNMDFGEPVGREIW